MTIKGDNLKVYHNMIEGGGGAEMDNHDHQTNWRAADDQSDTVIGS